MKNGGQITVFLSLVLCGILALMLSATEIVRISVGNAKAAVAAEAAALSVQAAYNRELFEVYHLLAIDKEFGGQGEGKLEQMAEDYLVYTLCDEKESDMQVSQVALSGYVSIVDDDYKNLRRQISEYMKLYMDVNGTGDIIGMLEKEKKAGKDSVLEIEKGKNSKDKVEKKWIGKDPRKTLNKALSGGVLELVVPAEVPSKESHDIETVPADDVNEWEDIAFDNMDELTRALSSGNEGDLKPLTDNVYGIYYALKFFNTYTEKKADRPLCCEVEYMIGGKTSDYANLSSVVNRIILHRFPVVYAYIVTDKSKISAVCPMAAVLSIVCRVSYSTMKYLLLGCWAYGETLADIRVLLSGKKISFVKKKSTWLTDISDIGKLCVDNVPSYEGTDGVDYNSYLALLLAECSDKLYGRIASVIQFNIRQNDEQFQMDNMIYSFSLDITISQQQKFAAFVYDLAEGVDIDGENYEHRYRITKSY